MIHMLSNFDLKSNVDVAEFEHSYLSFIHAIRKLDLIASSGPIGQRVKDTPMDTAQANEPEFYTIMSFRDRVQLDAAYEYFLNSDKAREEHNFHGEIHKMIANPVFTCWQDRE